MPHYEAGKCFDHATERWVVYDMIDGDPHHMTPEEARIYADEISKTKSHIDHVSEIIQTMRSMADEVEALNRPKH